jgi:hypothetical protein
MTRVSYGFQLRLRRENFYFNSYSQDTGATRPASSASPR